MRDVLVNDFLRVLCCYKAKKRFINLPRIVTRHIADHNNIIDGRHVPGHCLYMLL